MNYATYIWSAYGIAAVVLVTQYLWTCKRIASDWRHVKRWWQA